VEKGKKETKAFSQFRKVELLQTRPPAAIQAVRRFEKALNLVEI
jgi:hypothetical protein